MLIQGFESKGVHVIDNFLSQSDCVGLIRRIRESCNAQPPPLVHRWLKNRPLHYFVLDGYRIVRTLPDVMDIYAAITSLVLKLTNWTVVRFPDQQVACNVNITPAGGSYRYHYDRNAVTAILYLNETPGGETECYPDYRIPVGGNDSRLQQFMDLILQNGLLRAISRKQMVVRPRPGRLLIMQGDRCLHSVYPVRGDQDRINIVMAYDTPNSSGRSNDELNSYLYETGRTESKDPNYRM